MYRVSIYCVAALLSALALSACEETPRPHQGADLGAPDGASGGDGPAVTGDGPVTAPDGAPAKQDSAGPADSAPPKPDAGDKPWVKFVSPKNKTTVKNPVTFTVAAHKVATVRIYANQWPLSAAWDPKTKTTLSYKFNYTSYERLIELFGYDKNGKQLAKDVIRIWVSSTTSGGNGTPFGQMYITYYYMAQEKDYSGAANTTISDSSCKPIAKVAKKFYDALCIEGSGKLNDGRVINYAKKCSCAAACSYKGARICYSVLNKTKYPWGSGSGGPLVPLRTWAVDTKLIKMGTLLYAKEWDGVAIPKVDGIGGFTHDGCFRAGDVGGAIKGMHYDFFSGTKAMASALNKGKTVNKSYFSVNKDPGKCKYLTP